MQDKKYKASGIIEFALGKDGIVSREITIEEIVLDVCPDRKSKEFLDYKKFVESKSFTKTIYDIMDGLEFLKRIDLGGITDYDGSIAEIYVDNKISNLGLAHEGFSQGKFLVTADIWKELCKLHKIEVNWANK